MKRLTITVEPENWEMLKDYYRLTEMKFSATINKCIEKALPKLLAEVQPKE